MANPNLLYLYKEARLNLEPAYPGSIISLSLPSEIHSTFGSRPKAQRTIVTDKCVNQDEEAFAKRHLASEASVFFRGLHNYPRSFLWRILDDRKTLEIRSVDLEHDLVNKHEANLTLLLHFPSPIRPFGIAFAEPEHRDALNVYAITVANELYTLTLHRDFFCKPATTEGDIRDWCKSVVPASFSIRHPYRLFAVGPDDLFVTLSDGAVQHFSKKKGDDGSSWAESGFKENSWSLKGLVTWGGRNTVRFNNIELDNNSAAAVALSPDTKHIFTVCLNHTLKAWNLKSGKVGVHTDLLNENERQHDNSTYLIGPSQPCLVQMINLSGTMDGADYYVITYSPKRHQFKFWAVRDADSLELGFQEIFTDVAFIPPVDDLMDTTVWNLEEFHFAVNPSGAGWQGSRLWIRARSGPSSKVYCLAFDPTDASGKLEQIWRHEWTAVDAGPLTIEGLKKNPANPAEQTSSSLQAYNLTTTEKWLDFLFSPGVFTTATLETALFVYRRGLSQKKSAEQSEKTPLKERIAATISACTLQGRNDGQMDYDDYEDAIGAQWEVYYGLVRDLHKRRGESLCLAFDHNLDLPYLILTDYLSPVRRMSATEILQLNSDVIVREEIPRPIYRAIKMEDWEERTRLLHSAAFIRHNLSAPCKEQFQRALEVELFQSPSVSVLDRMATMEEMADIVGSVSDEDLENIIGELGNGGLRKVSNDFIFRALEVLDQQDEGKELRDKKQITSYGLETLSRISVEQLELARNVLLDLLILVLFVQLDDPNNLPQGFDGESLFVELTSQLRFNTVFLWVARTVWSRPALTGPASQTLLTELNTKYKGNDERLPIDQTVMKGIWGPHTHNSMSFPNWPMTKLLTYWARNWTAKPVRDFGSFERITEHTMAVLLEQREYELAAEFSKFLEESNWAAYLMARLHLAQGEYTLASIHFRKAAYHLARGMFNLEEVDLVALIPQHERDQFSAGLPLYYSHILSLYEKAKAYSYVADYARLGLQSMLGASARDTQMKDELLSRLFNASIQTHRYEDAYHALTRLQRQDLRTSYLTTLITNIVTHSRASLLTSLPWTHLHNQVEDTLESQAQKTLNISTGPSYHKLLYAFRIKNNNYRGAAQIMYNRLQRLRSSSSNQVQNPGQETFAQMYLVIINALSCVGERDRWIFKEEKGEEKTVKLGQQGKIGGRRRKVLGIEELRSEYQQELDRVGSVERGDVPFLGGPEDEMDVL